MVSAKKSKLINAFAICGAMLTSAGFLIAVNSYEFHFAGLVIWPTAGWVGYLFWAATGGLIAAGIAYTVFEDPAGWTTARKKTRGRRVKNKQRRAGKFPLPPSR